MTQRHPAPIRLVASHPKSSAFTLIELLFAVAIVAILAAIAIPSYSRYIDRTKISQAIADIVAMQAEIERFHTENFRLPGNLTEAGLGTKRDPYGNLYQYLNFAVDGKALRRQDKSTNPLNTEYDLFSMGKNGTFKKQLDNKESLDDIVRAADGSFIGLAADF